jgi:hypothetical protein
MTLTGSFLVVVVKEEKYFAHVCAFYNVPYYICMN